MHTHTHTHTQNKPITESVHFTTALIGFAMLAIQGSLTKLFAGAVCVCVCVCVCVFVECVS